MRLPRSLLRPALVAVLALAGSSVMAAPAEAASGFTIECDSASTSCITFSGYAGRSVWKYPVNRTGNNCVNYVAFRLAKNGVRPLEHMGDGGSWAASARARGIRVDRTPAVGSIAQWSVGSSYAPTSGHVGYVEEVSSSTITISDSSWSGGSRRWRVARGSRSWPSTFIHVKDQGFQPPPSGTFVRVRETGTTYRLVGRAPVVVSTWRAFGGRAQSTYAVSAASLATLPARVADGTLLRAGQSGQLYRVAGGAPVFVQTTRSMALASTASTTVDQAAIDRAGSSAAYSRLSFSPANGAVLRAGATGRVYVMSRGYAYLVRSWSQVGGYRAPTVVDPNALSRATTTGLLQWRHISGLRTL